MNAPHNSIGSPPPGPSAGTCVIDMPDGRRVTMPHGAVTLQAEAGATSGRLGFGAALLVTRAGACAMLGMSPRQFTRLLAAGDLPAPVRVGGGGPRSVRWRVRDLQRYVDGLR